MPPLSNKGGVGNYIAVKAVGVYLPAAEEGSLHLLPALDEFGLAGAERIKAQHAENIPKRHGAVVLVAGEAVVGIGECLLAELLDPIGRPVDLAESGINIRDMEARLI